MLTVKNIGPNVLRLLVDGEITEEAIQQASSMMEKMIDEHGKIRMLAEVKALEGYASVSAFLQDSQETLGHYRDFERVAVVADEQWLSGLAGLADLINPANVKQFSPREISLAEEWIRQQ